MAVTSKRCRTVAIILLALSSSLKAQHSVSEQPSPWDGKPPRFCVSLSGGGIRSGAVSVGVLQALQDSGLLEQADMLTTVSGGGYPVYGLVAAAELDPSQSLASLLDPRGPHMRRMEEVPFIDGTDGALNLILAILKSVGTFGGKLSEVDGVSTASVAYPYAVDIHQTFVGPYPKGHHDRLLLKNSSAVIRRIKLPYWIIQTSSNAGASPPAPSHRYEAFGDIFELSPSWIGSRSIGYRHEYESKISLMDSVVASAAAIDTPRTNNDDFVIPSFAKKLGIGLGFSLRLDDKQHVFLSDGGFIENQAVIPALQRDCQLILALDAAHDDAASMKSWTNVLRYVHSERGSASIPQFIDSDGAPLDAPEDAWRLPSHLAVMNTSLGDKTSVVAIMKLGLAPESVKNYPAATIDFWEKQRVEWKDAPRCKRTGLRKRCAFPQQATVTQHFSPEEFRAYRCLGYFMAQEFIGSTMAKPLGARSLAASDLACESRPR